MIRRDLLTGHWKPYIDRAMSLKPCYEGGCNGGEVVARILQDTAVGKNSVSNTLSGARRLRDAIVLGFQLQRTSIRDLTVPEWYSSAQNELDLRSGSSRRDSKGTIDDLSSLNDFEIIHGDLHDLPDTKCFLKSLAELASTDSVKDTAKPLLHEHKAAATLFNWEDEIYVTRAPGRLDVMGGIADYSGSLVLQMPIREACHVAVQMNHPSKH